MRIIFINPWAKSLFGDTKQATGHPHIGLAYLIATCKKHGYKDIKVFDEGIEKDDAILMNMISTFRPHLLAVTTFSYCYQFAKELIDKIKSRYPDILVIAGGPHVSATREQILRTTKADFAMKSESEITFVDFLKELEKPKPDFSRVNNLIWKDNGVIVENADAKFIEDLDSLPFPDYSFFGIERYLCHKARLMPLITSRGCPYGCNYCSIRLSMGRNFRKRSPRNVIDEIKYLQRDYGANHFEINDDCFALDMQRAEDICDGIIRDGLDIKYEIYNGIRADNVNERLLNKMKHSGCVFISYGCESGNQEIVNNSIGKNLDLKKVVEAVDLTNRIGIRNSVNFIIGHPNETYDTAMQTLRFARSLKTNFVNIYNLIPYPGTALYDWVEQNGTFLMPKESYLEEAGSRELEPVFETKEFTKEERVKVLKKGFALYERTVLEFRFGKILGFLVYLLARNKFIFSMGRKFVFDNPIGARIYRFLSKGSRRT